ncbi:MAG: ATP-binding protein [Acidimicrobiales bacterium]
MINSIRARLTLTIAILTAVLVILAVLLGTRFIEDDVIEASIDDRVEQYLDESGEIEAFFGGGPFFPGGPDGVTFFGDLPGGYVASVPGEARTAEGVIADFISAFPPEIFIDGVPPEFFDIDFDDFDFSDLDFGDLDFGDFEDFGHSDEFSFDALEIRRVADVLERLRANGQQDRLLQLLPADENQRVVVLLETGTFALFGLDDDYAEPLADEIVDTVIPSPEIFQLSAALLGNPRRQGENDSVADKALRFGTRTTASGFNIGVVADVTERVATIDRLRQVLWIAAATLVALASLATWVLTSRALRPVGAITRQVGAISSGSLNERVPEPPSDDEIGELAKTMNAMLDRLEKGDTQRRRFVSDASHELRTPVAVLRSEAEVALRTPDTTSVDHLANAVLAESTRMGTIVEDLLALARSDENRQIATRQPVDLDELLLAEAGRNRRLPIDQSAVLAGRVMGQPDELNRVIVHLLDNAARHGKTQIAVGVRPTTDRSFVELWVDDDGEGIPVAERERIFERFVRLDEARTRDTGGSGLGLAVVATTVQGFGGTVEVSESPLGGARCLVKLPIAP